MNVVSKNVVRLRCMRKLSQKSLAQKSGLSEQEIIKIEQGAFRMPRMDTLLALSVALEVPVSELLLDVPELTCVYFRTDENVKNRSNLVATATIKLKDYALLEELLSEKKPYLFKDIAKGE